MSPLKTVLKILFGIDPYLTDAVKRTDRLSAVVNGDERWMLTCKPKVDHTIECSDGNSYKKVAK